MIGGKYGWGLLGIALAATAWAGESPKAGMKNVHDFEMTSIDGKAVKLSSYEGKVLMIVNVASK